MSDGGLRDSTVWIDGLPLRDYLLTPRETTQYLRCSERKLERHRLVGDGPPFVKFGGTVRYPLSELEKWLAERTQRSTSETSPPIDRGMRRKSRAAAAPQRAPAAVTP
jgi:hypothetical protein